MILGLDGQTQVLDNIDAAVSAKLTKMVEEESRTTDLYLSAASLNDCN